MSVLKSKGAHVVQRSLFGFCLVFLIAQSALAGADLSAKKLKVVATFSVLADMVQQLGGQYVEVRSLVDWDEDAHVFQPSPEDVKQIASADLLIMNGLGLEGWLSRMLKAADYQGLALEATKGVELIKQTQVAGQSFAMYQDAASVYDPHAWHSLRAARIYADNISAALIQLDPAHESQYQDNLRTFVQAIDQLDQTIAESLRLIPERKKRLVVPHNAFAYLARDYQLTIHSLQGMSTDSEASAADMVKLVRLIKSLDIKAIFTETISDQRLIRVIEAETDATIEGALISGALSRKLAPSYLEMMRYNSALIIKALSR